MKDFTRQAESSASRTNERKRFKTERGHCYVLEDRLIITRNRKVTLEEALNISRWYPIKIGVFAMSGLLSAIYSSIEFIGGKLEVSCCYFLLTVGFVFLAKSQLSMSRVTVIHYRDLISVRFYGARIGRKNSFFEVVHQKDVRVLYTDLILPVSKRSGKPNTSKAVELMHELLELNLKF